MIGREVDEVESSVNEYLFFDADKVTNIVRFDVKNFEDETNYEQGLQGSQVPVGDGTDLIWKNTTDVVIDLVAINWTFNCI